MQYIESAPMLAGSSCNPDNFTPHSDGAQFAALNFFLRKRIERFGRESRFVVAALFAFMAQSCPSVPLRSERFAEVIRGREQPTQTSGGKILNRRRRIRCAACASAEYTSGFAPCGAALARSQQLKILLGRSMSCNLNFCLRRQLQNNCSMRRARMFRALALHPVGKRITTARWQIPLSSPR